METVGNILCELPNKPEKYVVIMYRGNKIMSGFTNIVYLPTPVLFINYFLKHILLYADTDSVITIKEGK